MASTFIAPSAPARADEGGGVVGWVESTHGAPVAGAVISLFGKGIRGGNLITLTDSQGQFVLPSLPPGSYTLRAIGTGHQPSPAQHVTVLPHRDSLFTVSLTPVGEEAERGAETSAADRQSEARREWQWLMRHKRRSVLETTGQDAGAPAPGPPKPSASAPAPASLAELGPLAGTVELVATSNTSATGDSSLGMPGGLGALRLSGRLADGVRWSLGGLMAENEGRAWRTAAEFVIEPGSRHEILAGAGYGADASRAPLAGELAPPEQRAVGAVFARDRWRVADRLTATTGVRYTYIGFLPDSNHADAILQLEVGGTTGNVVRGSIETRTLAPGGDLLTLSTVASSPAMTWARLGDGLRASRTVRTELGVEHRAGASRIATAVFGETTSNSLLTTFDGRGPFVRNAGHTDARGFGLTLGHRFGRVLDGSLTYTFGRARRDEPFLASPLTSYGQADYHDLVARLETVIDWTDTRVSALYRLNTLAESRPPLSSERRAGGSAARFDVQLTQGLPFLEPLTRADWELLLAVRNMFYEASEGGFLDEFAVQDPPTRVVGGISVRF